MKLLFVIKTLALSGGGAERVLAEVTAGLAGRDHRVIVATFDEPDAADYYPFDRRVKRIRLGVGNIARPSGPLTILRRAAALRRLLGRERPDVAVGFMHSAYVPLAIALPGSGVPAVASEHIVYGHYEGRRAERALLGAIPRLFHSITAISEEMRRGFPARIRCKMTIVPNPVGAASRAWADVRDGTNNTVLAVGRLEEQKDQRTLIAAFGMIAPRFPGWRLRILGEGVLRAELEAQIATLSLEDRIALPGATADIGAEYGGAQLFAMPSTYESFGLATAEAMAHGVPVVGFADCPGTNELIVDGENGLLVAGADRPAALAEGLARLMASEKERVRMGTAAPAAIAAFAPERIVERWEKVILAAASGQPPPL